MQSVNIYEAKTHLSRFVDQAVAGEEIIVARAGKPTAGLVALRDESDLPRVLGLSKGRFSRPESFDALHAEEIRAITQLGRSLPPVTQLHGHVQRLLYLFLQLALSFPQRMSWAVSFRSSDSVELSPSTGGSPESPA